MTVSPNPNPTTPPAEPFEPEPAVPVLLAAYAHRATELGHRVRPAPPSMSNKVERWCCACGAVVLRNDAGDVYGTALTERCTTQAAESGVERPPNAS